MEEMLVAFGYELPPQPGLRTETPIMLSTLRRVIGEVQVRASSSLNLTIRINLVGKKTVFR